MPRSVTFREVRGRGLLVSTWINSRGPFTFAVDTGAGITVISPRVAGAAAVAIQDGPGPQIAGLSGTIVSAQAATAQTIAVGEPENYLGGRTNMIISTGLPRDLDGLLDPNDAFVPHLYLKLIHPDQQWRRTIFCCEKAGSETRTARLAAADSRLRRNMAVTPPC